MRIARGAVGAVVGLTMAMAAPARGEEPVVALACFDDRDLPAILEAVEPLTRKAKVIAGTYGIDPEVARALDAVGVKHAPVFTLLRSKGGKGARAKELRELWKGRRLTAEDEAKLQLHGRWARTIPPIASMRDVDRLQWGRELGERMRDAIRERRARGVKVDTWQLDEVWPSASRAVSGQRIRTFTRGVLQGLFHGRARLGDQPMRGIVYVANKLRLSELPRTAEVEHFFSDLHACSLFVAGEEYPRFAGDPAAIARQQGQARRNLAKSGGARRGVASRYLACITPGYLKTSEHLGGNVHGWSTARVDAWRATYVKTRATEGVRGFAVFNFQRASKKTLAPTGNATPAALQGTFSAIGAALDAIRR